MAWISSLPAVAIGSFVLGHFFGEFVWQTVKHFTVGLYQSVKHKITD